MIAKLKPWRLQTVQKEKLYDFLGQHAVSRNTLTLPHLKAVCWCKVNLYFVHRQSVFVIRFGVEGRRRRAKEADCFLWFLQGARQSTSAALSDVLSRKHVFGFGTSFPLLSKAEGLMIWELLCVATIPWTPSSASKDCFFSNFALISVECGWYYPNVISLFFSKREKSVSIDKISIKTTQKALAWFLFRNRRKSILAID